MQTQGLEGWQINGRRVLNGNRAVQSEWHECHACEDAMRQVKTLRMGRAQEEIQFLEAASNGGEYPISHGMLVERVVVVPVGAREAEFFNVSLLTQR